MELQGKAIQIRPLADVQGGDEALSGMVELCINLEDESVNKFNQQAIDELHRSVVFLKQQGEALRGVLVTSGKRDFIVGADVTLFHRIFSRPEEDIIELNRQVHHTLDDLQSLPCATVAAIDGVALGGGFELCLALDYRLMSTTARVGLPEVKLGIFPGWGGTVRLPRMIGADHALEWICTGEEKSAQQALAVGVADAVVDAHQLRRAGIDLLQQCALGQTTVDAQASGSAQGLDYQSRRRGKSAPLALGQLESLMVFETAKAMVIDKAGPHYPAPLSVVKLMQQQALMDEQAALEAEARAFVKVAKHWVCHNLVGVFLGDQYLKKKAAQLSADSPKLSRAGVLGAGIMGAGIACQSVAHGVPVVLKDIRDQALDQGMAEAAKLLQKRLERGRMSVAQLAQALAAIRPTRGYEDLSGARLVVEAVVEDAAVKAAVLQEAEDHLSPDCILASNTSTISITDLASGLKHPGRFCGMHFFNPVHRMPLVEVIRGPRTEDETVAGTLAYARTLGKVPIVVKDCPGFLVNRILFPYLAGFMQLLREGIGYQRIDALMEAFGWPMGPAYLLDVVGIDIAAHAQRVMAQGYPDRMAFSEQDNVLYLLLQEDRLGQKSGAGFYRYDTDKKGRRQKHPDEHTDRLLATVAADTGAESLSNEQLVERLMLPMLLEAVRCLEEGIVDSAVEVDMGLVYGIGFPPFRGGALRFIDAEGAAVICDQADALSHLGGLYHVPKKLRDMAARQERFYND